MIVATLLWDKTKRKENEALKHLVQMLVILVQTKQPVKKSELCILSLEKFGRGNTISFLKTFGKIGGAAKARIIGYFRHITF